MRHQGRATCMGHHVPCPSQQQLLHLCCAWTAVKILHQGTVKTGVEGQGQLQSAEKTFPGLLDSP